MSIQITGLMKMFLTKKIHNKALQSIANATTEFKRYVLSIYGIAREEINNIGDNLES